MSYFIFVFLPMVCAEWVQLQTVPKLKGPKGEPERARTPAPSGQCWNVRDGCGPNIHAWTAETWATRSNASKGAESRGGGYTGAPRSAEGKMILLTAAQDQLMDQIQSHVSLLGGREARGMKGGMGSMEGALITISLLTFAVYLIKLVKMLIHAIHAKKADHGAELLASTAQPSVQTFVLSPGRRRRRRSISHHRDQWRLLAALDDLNYS